MSNLSAIVSFFQNKGVSANLIAGIVGNLRVESGFDPNASNSGEGAIGIAQWEGGRRTALQQWASAHGGHESDLNMQLGYLWHEMHTTESSAWQRVQQAGSAGDAAALWDQYYERSSGEARQERVNAALTFANTGHLAGGDYTTSGAGERQLSGDGGGLNKNDYESVAGLGSLLDSVPALKNLVSQALDGGWTISKFQNEVMDSKWWKNHSDTARQVLITQANDPATYAQNLNHAEGQVKSLSQQLGMGLTADEIKGIARTSLLTGNDSNEDWLKREIGQHEDYSSIKTTDNLSGEMAANAQQLQQIAGAYGLTWNPAELAHRAKMIATGVTTLDTYRTRATTYAKSAFPSFAKQLDEGETMADIANPYIQSASQILEMDPAKFDLYNPLIRKGLQGTSGKPGETPSSMPLWQFENTLRQDPRWQYTNNAKQNAASTLLQLGQAWGYNG